MLRKRKTLRIVFSNGRLQLVGPSLTGPFGEGLVQCCTGATFAVRGKHSYQRNDAVSAIAKDGADAGTHYDAVVASEVVDVILGAVPK